MAISIADLRLYHQSIIGHAATPKEVVQRLGAVQAQDYTSALWAVGLRAGEATQEHVAAAVANGEIVRTWPMRGTLHFVAAEDVRWMVSLLAMRLLAGRAARRAALSLDEASLARAGEVITAALQGGKLLLRSELMDLLAAAGIAPDNQRGYHILSHLAHTGLICFGPPQDKQDTFVLMDAWAPAGPIRSRSEALAELTRRYFSSHGPATVADLMWWSGLKAGEVREGLALVAGELAQEQIDGQTYWFSASGSSPRTAEPSAFLLPSYDEYLLGYRDRRAVLDPAFANQIVPGGNGVFRPIVVVNGRVVGTWRRTIRRTKVLVSLDPFEPLPPMHMDAIVAAAERYGRFLQLPVQIDG